MAAVAPHSSRSTRRRWAVLLGVSVLFHALLLGAFAFRMPAIRTSAAAPVMDVALVAAPPFTRPLAVATAKPTPPKRVLVLQTPPRYVAAEEAATGEAADAADLFGPVFADGLWPRPVLVRSEPCDPGEDPERAAACRRELLFIGLASEPPAGSNPRP
jgi:hypothetical protein